MLPAQASRLEPVVLALLTIALAELSSVDKPVGQWLPADIPG